MGGSFSLFGRPDGRQLHATPAAFPSELQLASGGRCRQEQIGRIETVPPDLPPLLRISTLRRNGYPEVWSFQIGGLQVYEKWLKDRRGRTLSYFDLKHYAKVV
jgi:hypothetical protein